VAVERATLSARTEASRALDWWRGAVAERDAPYLGRLLVAGTANVSAAALDRWRPAAWWCPCCDHVSGAFLWVGNQLRLSRHAVCPSCGSRSRHRGLALAIGGIAGRATRRVLHFAPEAPLKHVLERAAPEAEVLTTDLHRTDVDRPGEDIQALGFGDDEFDLVVCNHVLEHVGDDRAGVRERARITAPGGVAVVSVPGDWARTATVMFDDERINGHHRDYGTDVVELLREAFAQVEVVVLGDLVTDHAPGDPGLRADDRLFLCRP
jgi:SAM-dependent methyltransferase